MPCGSQAGPVSLQRRPQGTSDHLPHAGRCAMLAYLRFLGPYPLALVTLLGLVLGGSGMWLGFAFTYLVLVLGDGLCGDDFSEPAYRHPAVLDAFLYLAVPFILLLSLAYAWMLGSGDFLALGACVRSATGWDMFAARDATGLVGYLGGAMSLGLLYPALGTNVGHELTHRVRDRLALTTGRWLLAFTADAEFSIEHVYGHHARLATSDDPATARRGESYYAFLWRSVRGQTRSAWTLEAARLTRRGLPLWSRHNLMLRGWLMTATIAAGFFAIAGWRGLAGFALAAALGRTVLEAVNYFEHYGLVRERGTPVKPRHSWNSSKRLSNAMLFNLARHSHHHADGGAPYWRLRSTPAAPTLPFGYLTSMLLVYVAPGYYRRLMTPLLLEWDRRHATPGERALAAAANRMSGIPELAAA